MFSRSASIVANIVFIGILWMGNSPMYSFQIPKTLDHGNAKDRQAPRILDRFDAISKLPPIGEYPLKYLPSNKSQIPQQAVPNFVATWKYGSYGQELGQSGIIARDLNKNGIVDIICAGSLGKDVNVYWYIVEFAREKQTYEMRWISDTYINGISTIQVSEVAGRLKIFIGSHSGELFIHDGGTLELESYLEIAERRIEKIALEDLNNDLTSELILSDGLYVYVYDLNTMALTFKFPAESWIFAVGNMDSDTAKEIVLVNGNIFEFKRDSVTFEWDCTQGQDEGHFSLLELANIDSDNALEIVGVNNYKVYAFDLSTKSQRWYFEEPDFFEQRLTSLLSQDIDGDGIHELFYSGRIWPSGEPRYYAELFCLDVQTQNLRWSLHTSYFDVHKILISNTDSDEELELIFNAEVYENNGYPQNLYIYDINSLAYEWSSTPIDGPFSALDVGDIDKDGNQEIVFGSYASNAGYRNGILFAFDAITHNLEWQSDDDLFERTGKGIRALKIADVDNDGENEITIAADKGYRGALYILDGKTREIEASYVYDDGSPLNALAIHDIDKDGKNEIIAGGGVAHTGSPGSFIYVIDGATGDVEWKSKSLGSYWSIIYTVQIDDIDGDGVFEILATNIGDDNYLYIFDGITHEEAEYSQPWIYGLESYDMNNDGTKEIFLASWLGEIKIFDWTKNEIVGTFDSKPLPVYSLKVHDFNQDGNGELMYITYFGVLNILDLKSMSVLWQSNTFNAGLGYWNNILISDVDSDHRDEIILGSNYAVLEFEDLSTSTSVNDNSGIPAQFQLRQNYPNPFNAGTTISFEIPTSTDVKLTIYDLLGNEVMVLIDENRRVGRHQVQWQGKNTLGKEVASGLYMVVLRTEKFSQVRKILLLR